MIRRSSIGYICWCSLEKVLDLKVRYLDGMDTQRIGFEKSISLFMKYLTHSSLKGGPHSFKRTNLNRDSNRSIPTPTASTHLRRCQLAQQNPSDAIPSFQRSSPPSPSGNQLPVGPSRDSKYPQSKVTVAQPVQHREILHRQRTTVHKAGHPKPCRSSGLNASFSWSMSARASVRITPLAVLSAGSNYTFGVPSRHSKPAASPRHRCFHIADRFLQRPVWV